MMITFLMVIQTQHATYGDDAEVAFASSQKVHDPGLLLRGPPYVMILVCLFLGRFLRSSIC